MFRVDINFADVGYHSYENPHWVLIGMICIKCKRYGTFVRPNIIGDILHIGAMIIGQNPGYYPNAKNLTYVTMDGEGHSYTCDLIQACIKDFTNIYLTNVVKCVNREKINNDNIMDCSELYLTVEMTFIKPKVIICLGRVAYDTVLAIVDVFDLHNEVILFDHPGYLQRNNISEHDPKYLDYVTNFREVLEHYEQNAK